MIMIIQDGKNREMLLVKHKIGKIMLPQILIITLTLVLVKPLLMWMLGLQLKALVQHQIMIFNLVNLLYITQENIIIIMDLLGVN